MSKCYEESYRGSCLQLMDAEHGEHIIKKRSQFSSLLHDPYESSNVSFFPFKLPHSSKFTTRRPFVSALAKVKL